MEAGSLFVVKNRMILNWQGVLAWHWDIQKKVKVVILSFLLSLHNESRMGQPIVGWLAQI